MNTKVGRAFVCIWLVQLMAISSSYSKSAFGDGHRDCDREVVNPEAQFSFLKSTGIVVTETNSATGFLIGRDIIVTAAHVVARPDGQQSKQIFFFPTWSAVNYGRQLPPSAGESGKIVVMGDYVHNPVGEDWACIKLDRPIVQRVDYFKQAQSLFEKGRDVYTGGFQDNCSTKEKNNLVFSRCRTDANLKLNLDQNSQFHPYPIDLAGITAFYGCSLNPGASGSPALNKTGEVIGVMSIGTMPGNPSPTGAFVNVSKFKKCFDLVDR